MEQVVVNNLEELLQAIGKRKNSEGRIFLLFCGDTDKETGQSWCSDCVKGNNILYEAYPLPTDQAHMYSVPFHVPKLLFEGRKNVYTYKKKRHN